MTGQNKRQMSECSSANMTRTLVAASVDEIRVSTASVFFCVAQEGLKSSTEEYDEENGKIPSRQIC